METLLYSVNIVLSERKQSMVACVTVYSSDDGGAGAGSGGGTGGDVLAWGHSSALISTLTHLAQACLLT